MLLLNSFEQSAMLTILCTMSMMSLMKSLIWYRIPIYHRSTLYQAGSTPDCVLIEGKTVVTDITSATPHSDIQNYKVYKSMTIYTSLCDEPDDNPTLNIAKELKEDS